MAVTTKKGEAKDREEGQANETSADKLEGTNQENDATMNEAEEEFTKVAKRIETLTQVLGSMKKCGQPQMSDDSQIPEFLRHFVILLTCGQWGDPYANRVTAVAGNLTAEGSLNAMAITQNPYDPKSRVSGLGIDRVIKTNKGFEDVINGDRDAENLSVHIGDLWAAFSSYDPDKDPQAPTKLLNFVISRSFRKLYARHEFGKKGWKNKLSDKIRQWQPAKSSIGERWVKVPPWLEDCVKQSVPVTMNANVDREELRWEFSDRTQKDWAEILATMLSELRRAVKKAHKIRKKNHSRPINEAERDAIAMVGKWSERLFSFIEWKGGVVKDLVTKTDMADSVVPNSPQGGKYESYFKLFLRNAVHFGRSVKAKVQSWTTPLKPPPTEPRPVDVLVTSTTEVDMAYSTQLGVGDDTQTMTTIAPTGSMLTAEVTEDIHDIDEVEECLQVNKDGEHGEHLLRYLQALVAWPGAVRSLLTDEFRAVFKDDLTVGLVNVQPGELSLCSTEEMMEEYFKLRDELEKKFKKYCSHPCHKTVHAEATLMGLVSYLALDDAHVNHRNLIPATDDQTLREIIDPGAKEIGIAVGKDCCWCCNRLAYHLGAHLQKEFKLPRTQGRIYGWKPARVGIPVDVLKSLENDLWLELVEALYEPPRRRFRQNSGGSFQI
ncbi:hypothetical protein V8B97DRAFT_2022279 [Scleroderma yunnanense]